MCYVHLIQKFCCGHQEISPDQQQSGFCLFDRGVCAASDLGRYRVCYIVRNQYCERCQRIADSMVTHKRQWKNAASGPHATTIERQRQKNLERQLKEKSNTPDKSANGRRTNQLNMMLHRNLEAALQRDDIYDPQVYADIVRYVVSLPLWLNRRSLIMMMEPWFALMFDEDLQASLKPALRIIGCGDMFDDFMAWTSKAI
ncbi:hypothetical protein K445DRAFT_20710 [Daldinia sp. EC12]|nr:hypothetical protein F4774DRAFT_425926 [Daldinia eschscholtzii]OTB17359.1 hypothetical protein K445DRAFT_20710 [Daldinia sp. EC12]